MALDALYYIIGAILVGTAVFALIVAISAKKIDFGDRLFKIRDREIPIVGSVSKRGAKKRKSKAARSSPSPQPVFDSSPIEEEKAAKKPTTIDTLAGAIPSTPKAEEMAEERKEKMVDLEEARPPMDEAEMVDDYGEEVEERASYIPPTLAKEEEIIIDDLSRDLSIMLPKNMCLDEVFRLKITLIKSKEFDEALTIKELKLDKKEAEHFSLTAKKLGEKVTEATTRIEGLEEGPMIVRPIAIGNVAVVSPSQRIIYFDPKAEEIVIEFFLTPTRWSKELTSNLRIEFEQNYKIVKTVNVPVKIYKRKMEAIFGINISKWQYYVLFVYSAVGTLSGLISFFNKWVLSTIFGVEIGT